MSIKQKSLHFGEMFDGGLKFTNLEPIYKRVKAAIYYYSFYIRRPFLGFILWTIL